MSKNVLKVEAFVECNSEAEVVIRAMKEGASFKVHESLVPWNSQRATNFDAYSVEDGKATKLKKIGAISDYLDEVTFASRQSKEGRVSLKSRFFGFGDNRNADYIVLFDFKYQSDNIDLAMEGGEG